MRDLVRNGAPDAGAIRSPGRHSVCALERGSLFGFHEPETHPEGRFRWSGPFAVVRFRLEPGVWAIMLETRPLRPDGWPIACAARFDGRRVEPAVDPGGALRFRVSSDSADGRAQRLVLAFAPLRPSARGSADPRELGIPLFAVGVERLDADRAGSVR